MCSETLWLYTKGFSIIDLSPSSLIYLMANFWPLKATLEDQSTMQPVWCEYPGNLTSSSALAASRTSVSSTPEENLFPSGSAFPFPVLFLIFLHLSAWHGRSCSPAKAGHTQLEWARSSCHVKAWDNQNSQIQLPPCVTEVSDLLNRN